MDRASAVIPAGLPAIAREVDAAGVLEPAPNGTGNRVLHVVSRLTYGQTPALVREVERSGVDAFIERQLSPQTIDDTQTDVVMATFIATLANKMAPEGPDELQFATLVRAVRSERQLFEVMVEFWSNHFNVTILGEARPYKPREDAEVIRPRAMGRFASLLQHSAQSPAMLTYLNNRTSTGISPNENYGRELLELHTLGVGAGYTESDVRNSALAFTGWTVDGQGNFVFVPSWHHTGELRVVGWSAPATVAGPESVERGRSLLRYLARHPATARHVAYKLCRRFVSDAPPAGLVTSTANRFLSSKGDTVAVLRHLFASSDFWAARGTKFRRPFELVAAALRATGARVNDTGGLSSQAAWPLISLMQRSGHAPFWWPAPNGFPDHAGYWMGGGSHITRWNVILDLALGRLAGVQVNAANLIGDAKTVGKAVTALTLRLIGQPLEGEAWRRLVEFTGQPASAPASSIEARRLAHLVALVLSGPRFQVR